MTTGEKIKELRKSNNLTQNEFAEKIMVSRRTLIDWEHDRYSPQSENLISICKAFNLSLDYFIEKNKESVEEEEKDLKLEEIEGSGEAMANDNIYGSYNIDIKRLVDKRLFEFIKENKLINYNLIINYILLGLFLIILILSFLIPNEASFYIFFTSLVVLLFYFINRRYRYKYYSKLYLKKADYMEDKGNILSITHGLYFKEDKDRLFIYDDSNVYLACNKSDLRGIKLSINDEGYTGLLPENLHIKECILSFTLYFKDNTLIYNFNLRSRVLGYMALKQLIQAEISFLNRFKILFDNK